MSDEEYQKNVLGEQLEECSNNPLTGLVLEMAAVILIILI